MKILMACEAQVTDSKNIRAQRLQKLDASAIKLNENAEVYLRSTWEKFVSFMLSRTLQNNWSLVKS